MLTTIKLKLKAKRFAKSHRIQFDLEKLKDPKTTEGFQTMVGGKFASFCVLDSDVETLANSFKEHEVLDLCDQRRQLQQRKHTSTEAGPQHKKM